MKLLKANFTRKSANGQNTIFVALSILILAGITFSCKKKDDQGDGYTRPMTDSGVFRIESAIKKEINEYDISYFVTPPANESYSSLYLVWSTAADFANGKDSVAIAVTGSQTAVYKLTKLQQATRYYARIGLNLKGRRYYSLPQEFITDTFKLKSVGYYDPPRGFSKDDTTIVFTNLPIVAPISGSDTKVFLSNYECPIVSDQGLTIEFNVPASIPAGKYKLRISSRGMEASWADSLEVMRGRWEKISNPDIPGNPAASYSALVLYGTCYSDQKGYIIGGSYFNGPQVGYPNSQWPEYLLEFDGQQKTWTKRNVVNPTYFDDPHCYYYNNSIYVIAGHHSVVDPWGSHSMSLKKIHRLDLSSLTWSAVADVPYPTLFNLASFELNNEWYIGMGADSANRTQCCGIPVPSKKFWKYNPSSNQWTTLADFPGGHQNFPTCFSVNGKGYAFYGAIPIGDPNITTSYSKELWEYNPATNNWTNIILPATGAPPAGEKYQITVYNGKVYFISAQVRSISAFGYYYSAFASCLEWDPVSNVFKKVAFPYDPHILKAFYKQGNKFFYQSQTTGYFDSTPFRAFTFSIEQ